MKEEFAAFLAYDGHPLLHFSRGIPGIEPLNTSVSQKHQSKLNVDHGLNKSNLL
ncbi:hypothetical protein [Desulfosporosinus fructosivorans]|uniref:hypothetical protein n=1 Tax=Desulfosporosinus fructosivorans TaxID=2018669 RepID=UPI00130E3005|nr:hypothetical protein [Desulfosporosinus fructosivorans]